MGTKRGKPTDPPCRTDTLTLGHGSWSVCCSLYVHLGTRCTEGGGGVAAIGDEMELKGTRWGEERGVILLCAAESGKMKTAVT